MKGGQLAGGLSWSVPSAFDVQCFERFKRAGCVPVGFCGNMCIAGCRAQLGVTKQDLDHPHIDVRLQQMRGKAVAQGMQSGWL